MSAPKIQTFRPRTGLRGVGAFWVVLFHTFHESPVGFVSAGYLGVDLFFVLSGFIITHVHGEDFKVFSWGAYFRFLMLRIARIFPLHIVVLGLFAVFVFSAPGFIEPYHAPERWNVSSLVQTFLLVNNWFGWPPFWNSPSWSLSAEWLGYLAFPVLARATVGFESSRLFFLAAVTSIFLMVIVLALTGDANFSGMGGSGLVRMAGGFTTGCMVYRYLRANPGPQPGQTTLWACVLITLGISFEEWRFLTFFGFPALILGVVTEETWLSRLLCTRPATFIGEISFSIYMCHWPLLQIQNWAVAHEVLSEKAGLALVLLAICGLSVLSWKYIELPARNRGRRFIQERFIPH